MNDLYQTTQFSTIFLYILLGLFFFIIITMAVGVTLINGVFKKQNSFLTLIKNASQEFKKVHPEVNLRLYFLDETQSGRHRYYLEILPEGVLKDDKVDTVARNLYDRCNESYTGVSLVIDDRPASVDLSQKPIIFATDIKTHV